MSRILLDILTLAPVERTRPSKNRVVYNPPLFFTAALHMRAIPQLIIILDCHFEGENLLSSRFEGASNTIYGTWDVHY
jgi:hypothetical protein